MTKFEKKSETKQRKETKKKQRKEKKKRNYSSINRSSTAPIEKFNFSLLFF